MNDLVGRFVFCPAMFFTPSVQSPNGLRSHGEQVSTIGTKPGCAPTALFALLG